MSSRGSRPLKAVTAPTMRSTLLEGRSPNGMAGQAGDGGRVGTLAAHVADDDRPCAVPRVEGVEEVSADLVALTGGQIASGQFDAGDLRERVGEEAGLERAGHVGALGE